MIDPKLRRRLRNMAIVGLTLIGAAAAYIHFYLYLPMGSGPAGPPVPLEPFRKPWTDRPILLLGLGDSVTAGLGTSRSEYSYFRRLIANPSDEFSDMEGRCLSAVLPKLSISNLAVSGSDSSQHLNRIEEAVEPQPAEVFGL